MGIQKDEGFGMDSDVPIISIVLIWGRYGGTPAVTAAQTGYAREGGGFSKGLWKY